MKSNKHQNEIKSLEFGKYTKNDLLELADGTEINGGTGWWCAIGSAVSSWTCPTSVCTRSC